MKKNLKRMLTLLAALAVLSLPLACAAQEEPITGWTMIDGLWYYVDVSGELLDHDPYLFTLPPTQGEYPVSTPSDEAPESRQTLTYFPQPEVEKEPEPEAQPEPEIVKEPEPEIVKEPEAEPEAQPEPEIVKEPEAEIEKQPEPETVKEPEAEIEKQPEPEDVKQPEISAVTLPEDIVNVESEPTPQPAPETQMTVSIYAAYSGDDPHYGSTVQLLSLVGGAPEGAQLRYQWQYKDASGQWNDVPGGNGSTHEYVLTEENDDYAWRLVVTP